MPRSIWRGVISFGMVSVPVKLYAATQNKDLSFNQLHTECNSRIKYKKWCPVDEREVVEEEIVRGYQYEKDHYVLLTDQDLDQLPVPSKHVISLSGFVKQEEIDPVYLEKSYWIEPEETGLKPYALLMGALGDKGVVGLASITLRNRESPCMLRPSDGALMLETLLYADEVRLADRPKVPDVVVSEQELSMADSLIDLLQTSFEPEKQHDEYRATLLQLIEAKKQGRGVVGQPEAPMARTPDLLSALRASLEAAKKGTPEPVPEASPAAPRKRRKVS